MDIAKSLFQIGLYPIHFRKNIIFCSHIMASAVALEYMRRDRHYVLEGTHPFYSMTSSNITNTCVICVGA